MPNLRERTELVQSEIYNSGFQAVIFRNGLIKVSHQDHTVSIREIKTALKDLADVCKFSKGNQGVLVTV